MNPILFDCETGSLPLEQLIPLMPQFEPDSRLKDEAKIKASIEAKKKDWLDSAALSPLTGRVLAVGYMTGDTFDLIGDDNEPLLLEMVWRLFDRALSEVKTNYLVGFNVFGFDMPFLMKRSWHHGVKVPRIIGCWSGRYWNWNDAILDLRLLWLLGDRQGHGSLDDISRFFGQAGKSGSGKDFAMLWNTDRAKAVQYLEQDLRLTKALYERMCL